MVNSQWSIVNGQWSMVHKNYEDIINHPHHVSKKHPPMSMLERAAQFAPFAALTGYGDAIDDTKRKVEEDYL